MTKPDHAAEVDKLNVRGDRLCIDLCCGRKGFSRAFAEAGWEVVTVDIDPKFEPTICADVIDLLHNGRFMDLEPELILTSPPCERMSMATDWPQPGIFKGLSVIGACLEIVARMRPKYWGLENPSTGRLRWFIGAPTKRLRLNAFGYKTVKPTGIWGNIPLGLITDSPRTNGQGAAYDRNAFANGPRSPAKRAEMPFALSQAILEAVSEPSPLKEPPQA